MKQIVDYDKCSGCQACGDVCPKDAIRFVMKSGFWYPEINESKCVDCHKCEKVCPVCDAAYNDDYDEFIPEAYAAWNTNEEHLEKSASGGMFATLAAYYLETGGYVAGCIFSDDYKSCRHIVTNDWNDFGKMVGSKYFQSEMSGVYSAIEDLLVKGEKVLFCGTPCQAAALHKYLEGTDRSQLLIVDLLCKGVPSPLVHQKLVEDLEKKERSPLTYFRSKSKVRGWGKQCTELEFKNGTKKIIRSPLDPLFVVKAVSVRKACAACEYKGYDRVSDLSIGDYWGVKGIEEKQMKKGVSALVVNTQKGDALLKALGERIQVEKRSVFDVSNHRNPGYGQTVVLHPDHDRFFEDLETESFHKVLKKYGVNNSLPALAWRKGKWVWSKVKHISLTKFIYINFLCKHVKRGKRALIIPGYNTYFTFGKGSVFTLEHGIALINIRKPRGSKEEAWIQLDENARLVVHKGLDMRNCRIGVQKDAVLEIGDLEMNGLCNFMARQSIRMGEGVMIARNVTIYDSDYHPFSIGDNVQSVATKPVVIGNDVWIGNGATIMKGVHIGDGAVVGSKAFVVKRVKPRTMVSGNPAVEVCKDVYWSKGH